VPRRRDVGSVLTKRVELERLKSEVGELRERFEYLETVVNELVKEVQAFERDLKKLKKELHVMHYWLRQRGYKLP